MENILLGAALKEPGGRAPGIVFLLVIGIALVALFARARAGWAGLLALAAIAGAQGFTWYLFSQERVLFENLLHDGFVPNAALFVDGLNDFYNTSGLPPGAAALAAVRNGLSVIMTEETDWIGGQLTAQGFV